MLSCLKKRHLFLAALVFLVILFSFLFPQIVSADSGNNDTLEKVAGTVAIFLKFVLYLVEALFNLGYSVFLEVIQVTIFDFGTHWSDSGWFGGVKTIWQIARDVVNFLIVILFVFVAAAITFGDNAFGVNKQSLIALLVSALLVNFSAFFTLLLFDVSHMIFAIFFNLEGFKFFEYKELLLFTDYNVIFSSMSNLNNAVYLLTKIVVYYFMLLGFFYFCIILIERLFWSFILVVSSPIALLGGALKLFKGGDIGRLTEFWGKWVDRISSVLLTPVILIFGLSVMMQIFHSILSSYVTLESLTKLDSFSGGFAVSLLFACILFIYGIFKVGELSKKSVLFPIATKTSFREDWKWGLTAAKRAGRAVGKARKPVSGVIKNIPGIRNTKFAKGEPGFFKKTWSDIKNVPSKVYKGERVDSKDFMPNTRARRGVKNQVKAALKKGWFRKKGSGEPDFQKLGDISSRSDLHKSALNNLISFIRDEGKENNGKNTPLIRKNLLDNANLTPGQIRDILFSNKGGELEKDKNILLAAIKNKSISKRTLKKIATTFRNNTEYANVRRAAESELEDRKYPFSEKPSPESRINFVNFTLDRTEEKGNNLSESDEDELEKRLGKVNSYDSLVGYINDKEKPDARNLIASKVGTFFMKKPNQKKLFEELIKDGDSTTMQRALRSINDAIGTHEKIKDSDIKGRVSESLTEMLDLMEEKAVDENTLNSITSIKDRLSGDKKPGPDGEKGPESKNNQNQTTGGEDSSGGKGGGTGGEDSSGEEGAKQNNSDSENS